MIPEFSKAQIVYLRSLALFRDGVMQRRCQRSKWILTLIMLTSLAGAAAVLLFDGPAIVGAGCGTVFGAAGVLRMQASYMCFKAPVFMEVCNWDRVDELLNAQREP